MSSKNTLKRVTRKPSSNLIKSPPTEFTPEEQPTSPPKRTTRKITKEIPEEKPVKRGTRKVSTKEPASEVKRSSRKVSAKEPIPEEKPVKRSARKVSAKESGDVMVNNDKLFYYSKSKDVKPGKGTHEYVENSDDYKELAKVKDWRKILSNFYVDPFKYNGFTYNTVEHAFQSEKIKLVSPDDAFLFTLDSKSELGMGDGSAARKARKMHTLNKEQLQEWDQIKDKVMKDISYNKFTQAEIAKKVLLLTGNAQLWHIVMRDKPIHTTYLEEIRNDLKNGEIIEPEKNEREIIEPANKIEEGEIVETVPEKKVEDELEEGEIVETVPEKKINIVRKKRDSGKNVVREERKKKVTPKRKQNEWTEEREREWTEELKYFLKELLVKVMDMKNVEKMLRDDVMDMWKSLFTHESFNFTQGQNYEEQELRGDKVAGLFFIDFLLTTYPTLNRNDATLLNAHYMSKSFQPKLADELDLPRHVRLGPGTTLDNGIKEDIFEALFGGLFKISDLVFGSGLGEVHCAILMNLLFANRELDFEVTKGSDKTRVKETFDKMGWGQHVPEKFSRNNNGEVTFTIELVDQAFTDIPELYRSSKILAQVTGTNKKSAEKEAYHQALQRFIELGINDAFVDEFRLYKDSTIPELSDILMEAQEKWQQAGYSSAILKKRVTRTKMIFIELKGRNPDYTQTLLATVGPYRMLKEKDLIQAKKEVLEKYLAM